MTPGNFCAHAIEHLKAWASLYASKNASTDAKYCLALMDSLARSTKFLLPNMGRLLDKGVDTSSLDRIIRLPFSELTVEFTMHAPQTPVMGQQTLSTRRIVHCTEVADGYYVTTVDWIDEAKKWAPCPIQMFVPYDIHVTSVPIEQIHPHARKYIPSRKKGLVFNSSSIVAMPYVLMAIAKEMRTDPHELRDRHHAEITSDWQSVLELCNVLACRNTEVESIKPSEKLNKKRVKNGKLPLFEYKVLRMRAYPLGDSGLIRDGQSGRLAPRQHIRRGHIRRYPNYTIWIEQMLVGNPERGRIEKDYEIKA